MEAFVGLYFGFLILINFFTFSKLFFFLRTSLTNVYMCPQATYFDESDVSTSRLKFSYKFSPKVDYFTHMYIFFNKKRFNIKIYVKVSTVS